MAKYSYNVSCVLEKETIYRCRTMSSSDESAISFGKSAFFQSVHKMTDNDRENIIQKQNKGIWSAQRAKQ